MNERIKALMLEAGYAAPDIAPRAQKLVELIVKECANLANKAENSETWIAPAGDMIKENFGVE